jgi:hypothetical protein
VRAIQNDRIGRRNHRGQVTSGVTPVALCLRLQDGLQVVFVSAGQAFLVSALRPFDGVGYQEKFTARVRKDNCPLIAALADHIAACGSGSLKPNQVSADDRTVGNRPGRGIDLRRSNQPGHVLAVEENVTGGHFESHPGNQFRQGVLVVQVELRAEGSQGDGTIHRSGIEELEAESPRQHARDGTFTRTSGAVNGDNHRNQILSNATKNVARRNETARGAGRNRLADAVG